VIPLSVSGAFHSPVMQPAAAGLAQALATSEIRDISIPIISNITAKPLTTAESIRAELAQQIAASVQWTRTIEYMANQGVTIFLEIGPGQALSGMVKRIVKGVTTMNIGNLADIEKAVATLRTFDLAHEI
jgi:[acyl-carrier-protein] S-malonyltransferase